MLDFERLGQWPPDGEEADRIARYKLCEQLFEGDHAEAFKDLGAKVPPGKRRIIYLMLNFPALISKVSADFLFSKPPIISAGEKQSKEQETLNRIIRQNAFLRTLHESALTSSSRGDTTFSLGVKPPRPGGKRQVVIRERPPSSYFAELDPDDARSVLSEALVWKREYERAGHIHYALRVEHHLPGQIWQEAFELDPTTGKVGGHIPLRWLYHEPPAEEEQTGVDEPLLVHVPNWRDGRRHYGFTDYSPDLISLFDAANNRLSKIDAYLDKHAAPRLVLPPGWLDPKGNIPISQLEVLEADPELSKAIRYVTWDGQMDASFRELEKIADLIFKFSEIAPAVFGEDKAGSIESGRAMKMRFTRTDALISRKKTYFDPAIRLILRLAQELEHKYLDGPAPAEVAIHWRDGIPLDLKEAVEIESQRVQHRLTTRQAAIQRLDQCTELQARAELAGIRAEEADDGAAEPVGEEPAA